MHSAFNGKVSSAFETENFELAIVPEKYQFS